MKQFNFTNVLIVIILALLVYLALKPDGSGDYKDMLEQEREKIVKQIEINQKLIKQQLDSLEIYNKQTTIIRNYYNEIISSVDTITNDSNAIATIRLQLHKLGSARLD